MAAFLLLRRIELSNGFRSIWGISGRRLSNYKNDNPKLAIEQVLDQVHAKYGKDSMHLAFTKRLEVVSTGSLALDEALGIGGFPKGRIVEIYGQPGTGKSTLALHVIAEAQKQGGNCVFIDAEHCLNIALAEAIGVNTKDLSVCLPACAEDALNIVDILIRSCSISVIVVDSVASLVPKAERSSMIGDFRKAKLATLMSLALRNYCHTLSLSQTLLIFTNQLRANLSTMGRFGEATEVTCGGLALQCYATMRLNLSTLDIFKEGAETLGCQVQVEVVKNKLAPPFRTVQFALVFGKGICRESEVISLGLKYRLLSKSGAFYSLNGKSFHGKDALKTFLSENQDVREELIVKIRENLLDVDREKTRSGDDTE